MDQFLSILQTKGDNYLVFAAFDENVQVDEERRPDYFHKELDVIDGRVENICFELDVFRQCNHLIGVGLLSVETRMDGKRLLQDLIVGVI